MSEIEREKRKTVDFEHGITSDYDIMQQNLFETANYDPISKKRIWDSYVKGELNQKQFKESSKHFYNIDDEAMCIEYGDKFFEVIEKIFSTQHRDYANTFFHNLSPTFLGRESYLDKYITMLERAIKTDNSHFINLLKDEIELLEEVIEIRSLQKIIC